MLVLCLCMYELWMSGGKGGITPSSALTISLFGYVSKFHVHKMYSIAMDCLAHPCGETL